VTVYVDIHLSATPPGKFHLNISRYPLNRTLGGSESRFGRCDENFPLPPSLFTKRTELALMKFRTSPNSGVDNRPPPPPPNKFLAKVTPGPITGIQNTTLCQKNGNQPERTQNKFNIQYVLGLRTPPPPTPVVRGVCEGRIYTTLSPNVFICFLLNGWFSWRIFAPVNLVT